MKKILTVLSGTVLEYYDYALFGFTAVYISENFFPESDLQSSLFKAFLVFSLGSIAKPLGALTFSHLGDFKGRRYALRWTMLGIALPTFLIGILPSYESWGWVATLSLILCRFFQGFLLSSEYDGVAIYIQEHLPKRYSCLGNSLLDVSYSLGILLASFMCSWCMLHFSSEWGWRIPYFIGGSLGLICFIVRKSIIETPVYEQTQQTAPKLLDVLNDSWPSILSAVLICGGAGAVYQFAIIFWPTFLRDSLHVWGKDTIYQTTIALTFYTFMKPLIGLLADKVGPEKFLSLGGGILATSVLGMIFNAQLGSYTVWSYYALIAALPFYSIAGHVVLTKYINVKERYRCINIGHSLGSMLFSGTTPAIAMGLWTLTGKAYVPLFYLLFFAPLAFMGLLILTSTRKMGSHLLRTY